MTERDLERILRESVQDVRLSDAARRHIRQATKEERPVKMKKFVAIALAAILMLTATLGIAEELGMFDFLYRRMRQEVLPEATEIVKNNLACIENEYAVYHVRQAAYDGQCAIIMVDITPKNDRLLLLEETYSPEEDRIGILIPELAESTQTGVEYAAENGLDMVMACMRNSYRGDCMVMDDWHDGTLTLVTSFNASEDEIPMTLTFNAYPYDASGRWNGEISTVSADITLKASNPLWQISSDQTVSLPDYGIRIDGLAVTGTPIQSYWNLQYTITDVEKATQPYRIEILNAQGEALPRGVLGVGGHDLIRENGQLVIHHGGFGAVSDAPEQLVVRFTMYDDAIAPVQLVFDLK